MDRDYFRLLTLLIAVVTVALSVMVIENNTIVSLKQEAIKAECAEYNQQTGKFEWLQKEQF